MFGLTLAAALVIGVTLGLLGGGGSILILPVLVYVSGVPAKQAIAMSLFVVAVTAAVGAIPHARAGRIRWRTGALFGVAAMAGAYAGGRLSAYLPAGVLLTGFGLMMIGAAVAMLRRRSVTPGHREAPVARLAGLGLAVGVVTGMVGAGGGFVIVPALALFAGVPMAAAVGTSLLVIAMQSTAGLLGHLHTVHVNWPVALAITAVAVAGSLAGALLAGRIPEKSLRVAFGRFLVAMSVLVLFEQAPAGLRHAVRHGPAGSVLLAAVAGAGLVFAARYCRCRAAGAGSCERPPGAGRTRAAPTVRPPDAGWTGVAQPVRPPVRAPEALPHVAGQGPVPGARRTPEDGTPG